MRYNIKIVTAIYLVSLVVYLRALATHFFHRIYVNSNKKKLLYIFSKKIKIKLLNKKKHEEKWNDIKDSLGYELLIYN